MSHAHLLRWPYIIIVDSLPQPTLSILKFDAFIYRHKQCTLTYLSKITIGFFSRFSILSSRRKNEENKDNEEEKEEIEKPRERKTAFMRSVLRNFSVELMMKTAQCGWTDLSQCR